MCDLWDWLFSCSMIPLRAMQVAACTNGLFPLLLRSISRYRSNTVYPSTHWRTLRYSQFRANKIKLLSHLDTGFHVNISFQISGINAQWYNCRWNDKGMSTFVGKCHPLFQRGCSTLFFYQQLWMIDQWAKTEDLAKLASSGLDIFFTFSRILRTAGTTTKPETHLPCSSTWFLLFYATNCALPL